jgi:uncharacterized protein YbcI
VGRRSLGQSALADTHNGQLGVAISNAVVAEIAATTGRGPTQARTTIAPNAIFVVLQDTLTRGERSLVAAGDAELVLGLRRRWQRAMQATCTVKIEELTGRKVIAFMSDNYIAPDVAVEVFILEQVTERTEAEPVPPQV